MSLACIPEWCAQDGESHDATCPLAPFDLTKSGFVDAAEGGARAAIEAYVLLRETAGLEHDEALQMAVDEANESAVCFAGIRLLWSRVVQALVTLHLPTEPHVILSIARALAPSLSIVAPPSVTVGRDGGGTQGRRLGKKCDSRAIQVPPPLEACP